MSWEHFNNIAVYGGSQSYFSKNILICVLKMNEGLTTRIKSDTIKKLEIKTWLNVFNLYIY